MEHTAGHLTKGEYKVELFLKSQSVFSSTYHALLIISSCKHLFIIILFFVFKVALPDGRIQVVSYEAVRSLFKDIVHVGVFMCYVELV